MTHQYNKNQPVVPVKLREGCSRLKPVLFIAAPINFLYFFSRAVLSGGGSRVLVRNGPWTILLIRLPNQIF